jgi:hypothetical protein
VVNGVPQALQKRLPAATDAPQAGQAWVSGDPQSPQKRAVPGFADPHVPQTPLSGGVDT